jgi:hypothetical protein
MGYWGPQRRRAPCGQADRPRSTLGYAVAPDAAKYSMTVGVILRKSKWLSRWIIGSEWNDRKIVKMKKKRKTGARDLANPHEPAPQECAASDLAQNNESSSALRVKISEKEGVPQIFANILLMEALGTTDEDFLDGILCQLLDAGSRAA